MLIWTAYSRQAKRVIAFVTGEGIGAAKHIYHKIKQRRPKVAHIFTDANSCYDIAFSRLEIKEPHTMTKAETHLIESSNSSIRDNLARFNRKTKRYSKSLRMLCKTLDLFFAKPFIQPILLSAMHS